MIYAYARINKICWYKSLDNFNLLPAILLTKTKFGGIIAFKWGFRHFGMRIEL